MAEVNSPTATSLATIGTICWCVQLIPQVIRNWYVRDCEGVPPIMFFLFAASAVPFAIYFIDQSGNTALIVQPFLFGTLGLIGYWQSLYYPPVSNTFLRTNVKIALVIVIFAIMEVACIIPLRHLYDKGVTWPNLIPGIIAAIVLVAGYIPLYQELFKHQGRAVGVNFLFLIIDSSGAVFNMASVAVQGGKPDILGLVLYILVFVLEYGIMLSHGIWAARVEWLGLTIEDAEDVEKWEATKQDMLWEPKSEPLREFCRIRIVEPTKLLLQRVKLKFNNIISRNRGLYKDEV